LESVNNGELKVGLQKRALLKIRVDRSIPGRDFQVDGVLHIKIHKSTLTTDAGLQGNTFFDSVILSNHQDQIITLAGPQANVTLDDAFLTAFATYVLVIDHAEAP
jgi:hypothetical protein